VVFCPTSVRGIAMRATRQDVCDVVDMAQPNRMLATDGFVRINLSPDIEQAAEILIKKADGGICFQDRDTPYIKGWNMEVQFCKIEPAFQEMLIGGQLLVDDGGVIKGGWMPGIEATTQEGSVQLEVWSKNTDRTACTALGGAASAKRFVRFVLPRTVTWTVSEDLTFEDGAHQTLGFTPPAGTLNDPDFNWSDVLAARAAGAVGYVGSDTLPTYSDCGEYVV